MGCDVHAYVETKTDRYGMSLFAEVYLPRWYCLFGYMAGVRGDGPAVAEPRGLPENMALMTRFNYDANNHHHPSWLSPQEFAEAYQRAKDDSYGGASMEAEETLRILRSMPEARLVFWFDN